MPFIEQYLSTLDSVKYLQTVVIDGTETPSECFSTFFALYNAVQNSSVITNFTMTYCKFDELFPDVTDRGKVF